MGEARRRQQQQFDTATLTPRDVLVRNTGLALDCELFRVRFKRETTIRDSDTLLAEKLDGAPMPARLLDRKGPVIKAYSTRRLQWIGDVTRRDIALLPIAEINIFESHMQRHRAAVMKLLQYFAMITPMSKFWRYAVITSGSRIEAGGDLREAKAAILRRISSWQRVILQRFGIELLLNVAEMTFDEADRSVHLHFNVMYWPHRKLTRGLWAEFMSYTWKKLGVHWQDNGRVRSYEELIKYVMKTVHRDRLSVDDAAWLYGECYQTKFITLYNSLRAVATELRQRRQVLKHVADSPFEPKKLRLVQLDQKAPDWRDDDATPSYRPETENLIRGRTGPMHLACAWAEPGTLVEGYTERPVTPGGKRRLVEMREKAQLSRLWWDANGAPDPITALRVSDAWICAPDHAAAKKIFVLPPGISVRDADIKSAAKLPNSGADPDVVFESSYRVHTTELTAQQNPAVQLPPDEKTADPIRGPPPLSISDDGNSHREPENKITFLRLCNTAGAAGKLLSEFFDEGTGEIFVREN